MTHTNNISLSSDAHSQKLDPDTIQADSAHPSHKHRVNWHEAAACAIEIELRDYADLLQFFSEYILGKNSYRIDLLVIKNRSEPVPKNIARIFKTYNLFEFKGIHSSLSVKSYYKTIGYGGLFIDQTDNAEPCTSLDLSISFLTFHYPRKLMKHLQKERHLTVEKISSGIYYISKETFEIQVIVTHELPPYENLYLHCLTDHLTDVNLLKQLADDYARHSEQKIYINYLQQLTNANAKGESLMLICEGLFNLYGTSSEEIIAKAKMESRKESDEYYLPKIDELSAFNEELISSNKLLSSQIDYLKGLLMKNNISFD